MPRVPAGDALRLKSIDEVMPVQISAFGAELGRRFRIPAAPTLVAELPSAGLLTFVRLGNEHPDGRRSGSGPPEQAFTVHVQMRDLLDPEFYYRKRRIEIGTSSAMSICLLDMEKVPAQTFKNPFEITRFYATRDTVEQLAEEHELGWRGTFRPCIYHALDPVLYGLATSLRPAFDKPSEASSLFVQHVAMGFFFHLMRHYGGVEERRVAVCGGLSPSHASRARAFVEAHLDRDICLADIAKECRLSLGHFSRAFKITFGEPPHRYMLARRIENAKHLLRNTRLALAAVAAHSGFADQSHMTRVFTRALGASPGQWRRCYSSK